MNKWDKISLYKFQRIDAISKMAGSDEVDRVLDSTCVVFGLTEYELDNLPLKKSGKLIRKMSAIFNAPFEPKPRTRIGPFIVQYDPASLSLGQYIEVNFFLQDNIQNAHYIMASITRRLWRKNNSEEHRKKADYFGRQSVSAVIGSIAQFSERLKAFNAEYSGLFGLDPETSEGVQGDKFNRRYGWIYSASQVAEYERITLSDAFALPIRQALNDLAYLKAKGIYEAEQLKRK